MIIGHKKIWQFLTKSVERKEIPQGFLFAGEDQLGKKTVAFEFVKWIFGEDGWMGAQKRDHPDLVFIEPEKNEIQIWQIRELIWKLSLQPFLSPFKAAILDQAHLMNQEAQNCFLKTLEEPKGKTILILITEYPEMLFPTILSRVQKIKFYPVAFEEIKNYLKEQGMGEKKAEIISQISQGKPGKAIDFLNQPQKLKEREEFIQEIIRLTKSDLTSRFQYAQKIAKSPQLKEILNLWLSYFQENLISNLNSRVEPWQMEKLIKIIEKIQETFFLISFTNVNRRLALETLILELSFQGRTLEE